MPYGRDKRVAAARGIQRSYRAQVASRARASTKVVKRALLSLSETQVLRRNYHAMTRINQPTVIPGCLWMSHSLFHTGGRNYGFHDARSEAAIRKSSEVYSQSVRFKMTLTANENIPNVQAKVYIIEYCPSFTSSAKLMTTFAEPSNPATAGETQNKRFWNCASTGQELSDLFVGSDALGNTTAMSSHDGRHSEFNRLRDTINTDTRAKYKVLREFTTNLIQPGNRGPEMATYLREQHDVFSGPQVPPVPDPQNNIALGRGDASSGLNDQMLEGTVGSGSGVGSGRQGPLYDYVCFDGPRAETRTLDFYVPFKRKLTYEDNVAGDGTNVDSGWGGAAQEIAQQQLALFQAEKQMIPEYTDLLVVIVAGSPNWVPTHVDTDSGKNLPIVRADYTTELVFRDT